MQAKKKICPTCGELTYLWNRSIGCKQCVAKDKMSSKSDKKLDKPMKRSPLKKVSGKKAKTDAVYSALRNNFLSEHPACQICDSARSTDIHHIHAGADREKFKNDTSTWMALCRDCHQYRVHGDPINARKMKWLK